MGLELEWEPVETGLRIHPLEWHALERLEVVDEILPNYVGLTSFGNLTTLKLRHGDWVDLAGFLG